MELSAPAGFIAERCCAPARPVAKAHYIDATALHKSICGIVVLDEAVLAGSSPARFERRLTNTALNKTRRHGKHLGIHLDCGDWLMFHFGMTGEFDYARVRHDPPKHSRLVLCFDNGSRLAYMNQRKLGRIRFTEDFDAFIADQVLGPDALEIERQAFTELLLDGRGTLKTRLMNQKLIAGLGKVYTDEVLSQTGIYPGISVANVTVDVSAKLWRTMCRGLRTSIDRRARPEHFPDAWPTPHRDDEECPRCGGNLMRPKIGGRTTRYCPACQSS